MNYMKTFPLEGRSKKRANSHKTKTNKNRKNKLEMKQQNQKNPYDKTRQFFRKSHSLGISR